MCSPKNSGGCEIPEWKESLLCNIWWLEVGKPALISGIPGAVPCNEGANMVEPAADKGINCLWWEYRPQGQVRISVDFRDFHLPHRYHGLASRDARKETFERGSIVALMSFKDNALRTRLPGPMRAHDCPGCKTFCQSRITELECRRTQWTWSKELLVAASIPACFWDCWSSDKTTKPSSGRPQISWRWLVSECVFCERRTAKFTLCT